MAKGVQLYQHPRYKQMQPKWRLYNDLYDGDHDTIVNNYLVPHGMESKSEDTDSGLLLAARKRRTRYKNFEELMVSIWLSILFRNEPTADEEVIALLKDGAIDDIDGQGTSLYGFVKDKIGVRYLLDGDVYVLADAFPFTAKTEGQARQIGARPFLEILPALSVVDWDIETGDPKRLGELNMLRHEFDVLAPRLSPEQQPTFQRVSNALMMNNGKYCVQKYTTALDEAGNLIDKDPASGEVAYTKGELFQSDLDNMPVSYIRANSWVKDVSEEVLRHLNLRSNLDNINYYQGYQKIFIKTESQTDEGKRKAMSAYVISFLGVNDDVIFGPPGETTSLETALTACESSIFQIGLNQLRQMAADTKAPQAANSQSMERDYTYSQAESAVDDIEVVINSALKDFAKFKGIPDFQGKYELDRKLRDEDMQLFAQFFGMAKDEISKTPSVMKAAVKKIVSKMGLPDEEKLFKDIDNTKVAPDPQEDPERQELLSAMNG
jgi:hypothetical protein